MTTRSPWEEYQFALQDRNGNPATDLLASPVHVNNARGVAAPVLVKRLCTLTAPTTQPNLIERYDGCSSKEPAWAPLCAEKKDQLGSWVFQPECAWQAMATPDPAGLGSCLPLDDPILAERNIVPVPVSAMAANKSASWVDPWVETRIVPVLKHVLESRNHSAASLPIFANVTVRPLHRRLRLGVCVAFPPIGSPCSLSAVDEATGIMADGWAFPSARDDIMMDQRGVRLSLARPISALTPLVGPPFNTLDRASPRSTPAFPFLTFAATMYNPSYKSSNSAWSIPLIQCARANSSTTVGLVRPLVMTGPCTSNRDCLSGVCSQDKMCSNHTADSPFSSSFIINSPQPVSFPPNVVTQRVIGILGQPSMYSDYLPEPWTYYIPVMVLGGVVVGVVLVAAAWMRTGRWFKSKLGHVLQWTKWRTTAEREMELKPVSGEMVGGTYEEPVRAAFVETVEELPMYSRQHD